MQKIPELTKPANLGKMGMEWLDNCLVPWVKKTYLPDSRKKKGNSTEVTPFTDRDFSFFTKSVFELSDYFTDLRPVKLGDYFSHARFRSAYCFYFLPLQAAKFLGLFDQHFEASNRLLKQALEKRHLKIIDVGSGPGTATFALLFLLDKHKVLRNCCLEITWIDSNPKILFDGKSLLFETLEYLQYPLENLALTLESNAWWKLPIKKFDSADIVLMGNTLNEKYSPQGLQYIKEILGAVKPEGAGAVMLEPASKPASQNLSQIRNHILEQTENTLFGPCLHTSVCPVTSGRDWCHFSMPTQIKGKWFIKLSRKFGAAREWLKFSYLWWNLSSSEPSQYPADLRRVISDPLRPHPANLLCEPFKPRKEEIKKRLFRGDLYFVNLPSTRFQKNIIGKANSIRLPKPNLDGKQGQFVTGYREPLPKPLIPKQKPKPKSYKKKKV